MGMMLTIDSTGGLTGGMSARWLMTSGCTTSMRTVIEAHRRSPWTTLTTALAKVLPSWSTSTSNRSGRSSSTTRKNTAWAERAV